MESSLEHVTVPSEVMEETLDHFVCAKENPGKVNHWDFPVKAICGTVLTEMPKFGSSIIKCTVCQAMLPEHIDHMKGGTYNG